MSWLSEKRAAREVAIMEVGWLIEVSWPKEAVGLANSCEGMDALARSGPSEGCMKRGRAWLTIVTAIVDRIASSLKNCSRAI